MQPNFTTERQTVWLKQGKFFSLIKQMRHSKVLFIRFLHYPRDESPCIIIITHVIAFTVLFVIQGLHSKGRLWELLASYKHMEMSKYQVASANICCWTFFLRSNCILSPVFAMTWNLVAVYMSFHRCPITGVVHHITYGHVPLTFDNQ